MPVLTLISAMSGSQMLGVGWREGGLGFGVWGLGFGVRGLGFRVWGSVFGFWVLRCVTNAQCHALT